MIDSKSCFGTRVSVILVMVFLLSAVVNASTSNASNLLNLQGETIPHLKYQLDNGLWVILHPDDSDPLVTVNITYHVGSAREELGYSGFAHLFEHMMFQGSANVADEEHFKTITESGGILNGSTNRDRTSYFQTVPVSHLEKVLWLEADRMGFFLPAITKDKFETQRETVKNERLQKVDNRPYGLRKERIAEALYPAKHPYSWPTIGYLNDLDRATLSDVKHFFKRWYGPNNAVLTIGGDINIEQSKAWVKKYFGPIKSGVKPPSVKKQINYLSTSKYLTIEDKVHLPLLQVTFPTVYLYHQDEAALDVLASILGEGKTSFLYKNILRKGLATHAYASHSCKELACEFSVIAKANPQNTKELQALYQALNDAFLEFERRGVQDDDLQRVLSNKEVNVVYALQSVARKVSTLASNQTFRNTPDTVKGDLARLRKVTKEDVMRVYKDYIKAKHKVVLSIVPKGQLSSAVAKQTFSFTRTAVETPRDRSEFTEATLPVDDFDRSRPPLSGPNKVPSIPDFWQHDFANGLRLSGIYSKESPALSLTIKLEGGIFLEPIDKSGIANLTTALLNESLSTFKGKDIAKELALIGSSISFHASGRYINIYVDTLAKNADKTLELLKYTLFKPQFSQSDFTRVKTRSLQRMQQSLKTATVLADSARKSILFDKKDDGKANNQNNNQENSQENSKTARLAIPDRGNLDSLVNISFRDVQAFHQQYFRPDHAALIIVGNKDKQTSLELLSFLEQWQSRPYQIPEITVAQDIKKGKLFIVDKPGSVQSHINIFRHGPRYDAYGEHFKLSLSNFILGGMFNSRLNLNLREDKAYTYGAKSQLLADKQGGLFLASANVSHKHTLAGIEAFLHEINTYQEQGMTADELAFLKRVYRQSSALRYETPRQKAGFLARLDSFDLSKDYHQRQQDIIDKLNKESLNKLIKPWLTPENMHILVVGDAKSLSQRLSSLEREIVVMNID